MLAGLADIFDFSYLTMLIAQRHWLTWTYVDGKYYEWVNEDYVTRFYLWAQGDARREVFEQFPLISRVRNLWADVYTMYMERIPEDQRLVLASGCAKSF